MSRIFRPARSVLTAAATRRISTTGPAVVHRVKLSRKGTVKRVFSVVAASYCLFTIYNAFVLGPLLKSIDNLEQGQAEEEDDELEPIFIPLPFTTKQVQPLPYSGKDPEWQEFIKTSKDKELQHKLRDSLAKVVLSVAGGSVLLTARFGKDLKIRRWWMDIDYPYRPPPEFERAGILLEDGMEIVRRKVDPNVVTLTQRILNPTPLLWSTVAFTRTLLRQNLNDVAKMLGWETKESSGFVTGSNTPPTGSPPHFPNPSPSAQKTLQQIRDESTRRPEDVKNPSAMVARKARLDSERAEKTSGATLDGPGPRPGKTIGPSSGTAPERPTTNHDLVRGVIGNGPWDAFKGTWAKTFRPARAHPPRGSFLVSGLVELETARATIVIDVAGWYNPRTKKYDGKSMYISVRRVQMKTQSPLR